MQGLSADNVLNDVLRSILVAHINATDFFHCSKDHHRSKDKLTEVSVIAEECLDLMEMWLLCILLCMTISISKMDILTISPKSG